MQCTGLLPIVAGFYKEQVSQIYFVFFLYRVLIVNLIKAKVEAVIMEMVTLTCSPW